MQALFFIPSLSISFQSTKNIVMDEDTRALLDSLEVHFSGGYRLTKTFMLRDKEKYSIWREKMEATLKSANMTRFVDGSLRDPDPKGGSEDERVMLYSAKWKKLDKQAMEWIRDSLDDTLKKVVKESKTSKDIWDMLRTHFGNLALLDSLEKRISHFKHVTGNIDILLPEKENYDLWMEQMNKLLELKEMTGFVDGSLRDPDPKGDSQDKNLRLSSKKWKKFDKLLMEWIKDSLDDTLKEVVKESKTSKDIWDMLSTYFGTLDQLDVIEKLISHGKHAMENIDILLPNKEKYDLWMEQMKNRLELKEMTGFVDGSLRDPDPKGESHDENVRLYSVKWEKLDTQVMEWIRDSLDDTLKEVVKESKTSKDIWFMLRTYFDSDTGGISSVRVREHVSIKLLNINKDHYKDWVSQMEGFLKENEMLGYVNGDLKDPGPKWEWKEEHVWKWKRAWSKRADKKVMECIMASLNDIPKNMVKEMKTAKELWDTLKTFFSKEELGPLDSNSLLMLKYETAYIEWKEHTESFLVDQKMGGFIDGTFRSPSKISLTIRQKNKAIVKEYSERWTLLDQHVMTLIESSLSVILHDIVKDLKSSKDFWHALEILCTTGYPLNTPVIEASFLSIKLSGKKNYLQWASQIKGLLEVHGLQNLIDPLSRPPPATFRNHAGWKEYNQLLKGWIFSSLEQNVIDKTITRIPTATRLWGEIKNRYDRPPVEFTDPEGEYNHGNYTELYTAIMNGDLETTTRQLETHGYDVELTEDGPTPLHLIIVTRKENYQYFEKVLDHVVRKITQTEAGVSTSTSTNPILVNLVNRDGRNTLHRAALVGKLNAARRLVDKDPYLLFKEDNDKCLPINVAVSTPHKDTFRYLLVASKKHLNILGNKEITESFGLINPFEGKHGVRLLNAAIEAGYMEVACQLLKMCPDIAIERDGSETRNPLHITVENYDQYYSLPISWRIFDQDAGMEFEATNTVDDETVPSNQEGTQNGGGWYKAWIQNLGKGFKILVWDWIVKMIIWNWIVKMIIWNRIVYTLEDLLYGFKMNFRNRIVEKIFCNWVVKMIWNWIVDTLSDLNRFKMFLWNLIVYPLKGLRYDGRWICARVNGFRLYLKRRAREDQHEALQEIVEHFPEAMMVKYYGYNLMQLAIQNRSEKVFKFLAYETKVDTYFFKLRKRDGNNLLHFAGGLTPIEKLEKDSGAFLQMRKEVNWFKKVEKFALPGCDKEKNNMGETPMMLFRKEHADLKKRGEEWMKTVANSYIIVAALIITITFAAIITVPGGSQQGSEDSQVGSPVGSPVASSVVNQNNVGLPVYIKNYHFKVFVYSDMISFCSATSALVMFLSILTSRYTEQDFINKLPWKLTIGLFTLIISLVGMLVAFGETLHLMLGHKDIPLLILIVACLGFPIVTFIMFQVRMILKIFR